MFDKFFFITVCRSCGGGFKDRKVECKQIMAQEHTVERPESMCSGPKPANKKPCNTKICPPDKDDPIIAINNNTYIQHDPKNDKVPLKIGGAATVFYGVQIKIKCPVKKYDVLTNDGHVGIFNIKINTISDLIVQKYVGVRTINT